MHAACYRADEVRHGDSGVDEGKGSGVYTGLEGAAVLLENLEVDVDLGARVEAGFDYGFKGGFNGRSELKHPSRVLLILALPKRYRPRTCLLVAVFSVRPC